MADDFYTIRAKQRERMHKKEAEFTEQASSAIDYALEAPLRAIRGDGWVQGDLSVPSNSVTGVNVSDPTAPLPNRTVPKETVNSTLDFFLDPLNLVGAGMLIDGLKAAKSISGAKSLKGNMLGSASNVVPEFYRPNAVPEGFTPSRLESGLANMSVPQSLEKVPVAGKMAKAINRIQTPEQASQALSQQGSFAKWLGRSGSDALDSLFSPESRALYREQGITKRGQQHMQDALASGQNRTRAEHQAVAQGQYTDIIAEQTGRKGNTAPALKELNERSYAVREAVPMEKGAYGSAIKDNELLPVNRETGKPVDIPDSDLEIINEHLNTVWKDGNGKPISETGGKLRIKNSPSSDRTGNHLGDFTKKAGGNLKKAINKHGTSEDLAKAIADGKVPGVRLKNVSQTKKGRDKDGLWITGSMTGSAITEGGVNWIGKVRPDGSVLLTVSDEHNLMERITDRMPKGTKPLESRSVTATPPMVWNSKTEATVPPKKRVDKRNYKEVIDEVTSLKPSKEAVAAERQVNRGVATMGAGMLTGPRDENKK